MSSNICPICKQNSNRGSCLSSGKISGVCLICETELIFEGKEIALVKHNGSKRYALRASPHPCGIKEARDAAR